MKRLLAVAALALVTMSSGAHADCYPPDPGNGQGSVDKSRVAPGECVVFSGNGFKPNGTVAVADNGAPVGTAKASSKGEFSKQVCFGSTAKPGQHELTGTGPDKGGDCNGQPHAVAAGFRTMSVMATGDRTVRATVYVLGAGKVAKPGGNEQGRESGEVAGGSGSSGGGLGLPFTGDMTLAEGLAALLLILLGAGSLLAARPRRRSATSA